MELSQQAIHDVIHPTAAFHQSSRHNITIVPEDTVSWETSYLNPKNRINSLDPVPYPTWRIDGCTAYGSQYYVIPTFLGPLSPLRLDLYIPELTTLSPAIRRALDVDVVFHTRQGDRLAHLGITRHILRIMEHWTLTIPDPRKALCDVPFGSRIILENLPTDLRSAVVTIAPAHYVERHMIPLRTLEAYWGLGSSCLPSIDIKTLEFVTQLHDSVCLVRISGEIIVFKALANHTKYLYHELRHLLRIPRHPNIISPTHLVTKLCSFGSKSAVVGFTMKYHRYGSLRDIVPYLRLHRQITDTTAVDWSIQLVSALCHLRDSTGTFYPDLRLDNIVLSGDGTLVMVDFEQRGVWCDFSAPEVNAFDHIRLLAKDESMPIAERQRYEDLLSKHLHDWQDLDEGEEYIWPNEGYNIAWKCLTAAEQEACEVYMLGRVLWCIFEAQSAPQRAAPWLSYRWEPLYDFPRYVRTPPTIRNLVDRCTRGRSPGLASCVVRQGSRLVLRDSQNPLYSTPDEVQKAASEWWRKEVKSAERWVRARHEGLKKGNWKENYYGRPTLREVHKELLQYQRSEGLDTEPELPSNLRHVLGSVLR